MATSLVALVDRSAMDKFFLGGWAMSCALTVAWGIMFPNRRILLFFFIPVSGTLMAWGTVVVTVVLAVYSGWEHYLPHLFAEGAMLGWLFRGRIRGAVSARIGDARRAAAAQAAARRRSKLKKSAEYLRVVESHDHDDAPAPPDIEKRIRDIGKRPPKDELN
jgi:hypothetical protein